MVCWAARDSRARVDMRMVTVPCGERQQDTVMRVAVEFEGELHEADDGGLHDYSQPEIDLATVQMYVDLQMVKYEDEDDAILKAKRKFRLKDLTIGPTGIITSSDLADQPPEMPDAAPAVDSGDGYDPDDPYGQQRVATRDDPVYPGGYGRSGLPGVGLDTMR